MKIDVDKLVSLVSEDKKDEAKKLQDAIFEAGDNFAKEIGSRDKTIKELESKVESNTKGRAKLAEILGADKDESLVAKVKSIKQALDQSEKSVGEDLEKIEKIKKEAQEVVLKENKRLKEKLVEHEKALADVALNYQLELEKDRVFTEMDVEEAGKSYLFDEIKQGACLESGKIIFKDEKGDILTKGGTPISFKDKVEAKREAEEANKKYFFFPQRNRSEQSGPNMPKQNNITNITNNTTPTNDKFAANFMKEPIKSVV